MKAKGMVLWALAGLAMSGCATEPGYVNHEASAPPASELRVYSVHEPYYHRPPVQDRRIDLRQREQQHRIAAGIRSGELTPTEARALKAEQYEIRAEEKAYKRDGYLSARERAELHRELNIAERNIYNQSRDRQDRARR